MTWFQIVEAVAFRDGWHCRYCYKALLPYGTRTPQGIGGRSVSPGAEAASPDHIIPRSTGGSDQPENIALACRQCNMNRATKPYHEWFAFIEAWVSEWSEQLAEINYWYSQPIYVKEPDLPPLEPHQWRW